MILTLLILITSLQSCEEQDFQERNYQLYEKILEKEASIFFNKIHSHFPDTIPMEAKEIEFCWNPPAFPHGVGIFFIGYELPENDILKLKSIFLSYPIKVIEVNENDYKYSYSREGRTLKHFRLSKYNDCPWPPHYPKGRSVNEKRQNATVIYLTLYAQDDWNHARISGVTIQENKRISYWATSW